ncbi:MAG: hypothetical protein ACRDTC_13150 [Pseudonocardiaceae bacterium]
MVSATPVFEVDFGEALAFRWRPTVHDLREVAAEDDRTVPAELVGGVPDAGRAWLGTVTLQGARNP